MTFQLNDPILIFQDGHEISGRFVEEDRYMTVINLRSHGRVCFDNRTCKIELDYQEKLIKYLEKIDEDNSYFKDLYLSITHEIE